MNAKKKNKNKQNKPPNLNPAQTLEVSDVETEKISAIEEKPKSDERVPEIVSEVVNPTAVEEKASETDTPKKPKRNRGKKKKSDKDFDDKNEAEDNQEQIQEQLVVQETVVISEINEDKMDKKLPEEIIVEPIITPSARKKKNKKKHIEQSTEDQKQTNQEIIITPFEELEKVDQNVMSDMKIVTLVPVVSEPGDQENKAAKKKNKKKKRTDSERSDKSEEILAVTAAFQKILEPREDKKDTKKGMKDITEPIKEAISTEAATKEISVDTRVLENKTETDSLTKSEQTPQSIKEGLLETTKDFIKEDGGKSKKKNKKDKKHPLKEEHDEEVISIVPETRSESIKKEDTIKSDNLSEIISIAEKNIEKRIQKDDQPKMHIKEQDNIIGDTPIEKEKSPKPKAKITKPVEKKQKGKTDIQNIETFSENLSGQESIVTEEKNKKNVVSEKSLKQKDNSTEIDEIKQEESVQTLIIKNIQVPESTDKKRKKSSKPTNKDTGVKEQDILEKEELIPKSYEEKTDTKQDLFPDPTCDIIPKAVELLTESKTEEPVRITKVTEMIQQDRQSKILENIPLSYETILPAGMTEPIIFESELPESNTEHDKNSKMPKCEQLSIPGDSSRKKRKKSPKPTNKDIGVREHDFSEKDELVSKSSTEKSIFEHHLFPDPTCEVIPKVDELPAKTEELVTMTQVIEAIEEDQQSKILEVIPLSFETISPGVSEPLKLESEIPESNTEQGNYSKMPECEQLSIPEASTRKKRKKSPKPAKKDASVKEQDFPEKEKLVPKSSAEKTDFKQDLCPDSISEILPKVEEIPTGTKTEEPIKITKVTEVVQQDQQSKILENIPISYETTSLIGAVGVTEPLKFESEVLESNIEQDKNSKMPECEQLSIPEASTRKKRKKSPKLPKQFDMKTETKDSSEKECKPLQSVQPFEQPAEMTEDSKEKAEVLPEIPLYGDIEIKSIKAEESEGSSSDIFPDIHYPRSVSQLIDNNNNMFIREITATDVKLNIPVNLPDTPFIQGSGETPSPDIVSTGIKITEMDPKTSKTSDQKTDLKSKVIEVNKDMDDLRKSIEKSLAELTAMETGEKETEKQFIEAQAKIEKIKEISLQHTAQGSGEKISETPIDKIKQPKLETSTEIKTAEIKQEPEVLKSAESSLAGDTASSVPPPIPSRRDNKGKGKSKKKGKHETEHSTASGVSSVTTTTTDNNTSKSTSNETKDVKKEEKMEQKTEETKEKGKQQTTLCSEDNNISKASQDTKSDDANRTNFAPIENFEDAMTSSLDDINKSFEMIANDANENIAATQYHPEINITAPIEDDEKKDGQEKVNPVSQPKNLLGHPDIPVRLNKTDYKKEKNKTPNVRQAKVKIKDAVPIEVNKQSKESQTENKRRFIKDKTANETICSMTNENEEYVYKYSFRKVFLPSACHVCKKDLKQTRVPCSFCNLIFYCNQKHKDEDYPQHQAFCFAVSTIVHLKAQKHIYSDTKSITGQDYRLLRMQMIVSCEKVLKRKLVPWEQESLLYPRVCADAGCREWRQGKLKDCEDCGQVAYCSENPDHLPSPHQRWCKSYCLYQRLVVHQQTRGRLELKMPTRIIEENYQIPEKMNEVLASMFEEKIDMSDIQYAALTQMATAPLTAAFCHQLYTNKINATYANGVHKKSSFTLHVVGAELQFEADALNKWEIFFLHLRPDLQDLRVVLIGPDLNPSKLPLDLLAKIKLCENCRQRKRRVIFDFQDGKTYNEYWSTDFSTPDLVCAFNPSIERSSIYNGKDSWPATIRCILKQKVPFVITSYTVSELQRDLAKVRKCADDEVDLNIISEPKLNVFGSLRPDRNFISDDEMPLLFKNYCYAVVCGGF